MKFLKYVLFCLTGALFAATASAGDIQIRLFTIPPSGAYGNANQWVEVVPGYALKDQVKDGKIDRTGRGWPFRIVITSKSDKKCQIICADLVAANGRQAQFPGWAILPFDSKDDGQFSGLKTPTQVGADQVYVVVRGLDGKELGSKRVPIGQSKYSKN